MQLTLPEPHRTGAAPFTVHTDVFDGPLDLLLYLVKRDGISLARLEVSRIADAYLAYLDVMRELDLAIAADWLVMAATLVHLKALELLPRPPTPVTEQEEVDPREALLEQLREYERVKAEAAALEARPILGRQIFVRPREPAPEGGRAWASPLDAFGLLELFHELLARGDAPEPVVRLGEGGPDIGTCCERVLAALGGKGGTADLVQLLVTLRGRAERVITFIGVLEMTRLQWLDLDQEVHLGPIRVTQRVEDEAIDLALVTGWDAPDEPAPGEQIELPLGGRTP